MPKSLPKNAFGKSIKISGWIDGIPKRNKIGIRFILKTHEGKILVSWYQHDTMLHANERWQFFLKLKPVHGLHNPGGFHFERWAKMQGIVATGYVIPSYKATLISKPSVSIDAFRERVEQTIFRNRHSSLLSGIINALSIGSKNFISPETWLVFQRTGTSHLMAISGLHVGLVVLISYFCANWLSRLFPWLLLRYPAQRIASVFSAIVVWWYGFLVGMSLPTQRAVIMVTVLMLSSLLSQRISIWRRLCFAFFVLLALQPLALYSPSFWLSFLAVFWIAYAAFVEKQWWRIKIVLYFGLFPIALYCFYQVPLFSLFINLIAIPWVTVCIVPLCLLADILFLFSTTAAVWVWHLATMCFLPLFYLLKQCAHWGQWLHPINDFFVLLFGLLSVLLLAAPRGLPLRFLGFILLLPLFICIPSHPKNNTARLTVLDVGQGLAAVVQTAHHVLVYDTGPRFSSGFDAGRSVVIPFLQRQGIQKVDTLIVSHGDNDHIGGSFWLVKHFLVHTIFSSIPKSRWHRSFQHCYAGQQWEWDGVHFRLLWPPKGQIYEDNNSSCVLRVSASGESVLLTGDIEKTVEKKLVLQKEPLSSDILVAPHHGSSGASSLSFVQAIHPKIVILSVGYQNRYHFPAKSVLARYRAIGAQILSTSEHGALQIALGIARRIRHNERLVKATRFFHEPID